LKTALGYMQALPGTSATMAQGHVKWVEDWARLNNLQLQATVFVDTDPDSSDQFEAMVTEIENRQEDRPDVVILPHSYALAGSYVEAVRRETLLAKYGTTTVVAR
jgi:hypothetical protein